MDNKAKKILGWALIAVGLIVIFSDLYSSINIFTARAMPPSVFSEISQSALSDKAIQGQPDLQKVMAEQVSKIFPSSYLAKLMNLVSWSIFATILVLIGGKACFIGISLLRDKPEKIS